MFLSLCKCHSFRGALLLMLLFFKWGSETPDLGKYLGEYSFALGQVHHHIYNSGNADAEPEGNLCDSQAIGIRANRPMWTTYWGIGSIIKVCCKSQDHSEFQQSRKRKALLLVDVSIKHGQEWSALRQEISVGNREQNNKAETK